MAISTIVIVILHLRYGVAIVVRGSNDNYSADRCIMLELQKHGQCPVCRRAVLVRLHVEA